MSQNDEHLSPELLERYLTGFASADERDVVRAWALSSPLRERQLQGLEHALAERRDCAATVDVERAWQRHNAFIASASRPSGDRLSVDRLSSNRSSAASHDTHLSATHRRVPFIRHRTPAISIGVCAAAALALWISGTSGIGRFTNGGDANARTFTTIPGQQATVRLADGSRVVLAPATTLRVATSGVTIDGEGYFQITPRAGRPVTVRTANAEVRVLGTAFSVRHYPNDRTSRVVVEEGKVWLGPLTPTTPGTASAIATARMLGEVTDSGVVLTPDAPVNKYLGWIHGWLEFDNTPLGDVAVALGRAYGAEIRVTDTLLAHQPMTMSASVQTESLEQLLEFVGRAAGARVVRTGHTYVLMRGRTPVPDTQRNRFPQPERAYGK